MNRLVFIAVALTSTIVSIVFVNLEDSTSNRQSTLFANFSSIKVDEKEILSQEQLKKEAKTITAKVLAGESWGSGIIVSKEGNLYTLVTNHHVLIFSKDKTYQVQAPDGEIYPGYISKKVDFQDNDLALVEFTSERKYKVASLATLSNYDKKEEVFAAGFPLEIESRKKAKGLYLTNGYVAQLSRLHFAGGYQIGYTNSVKKGMSGGPLLNKKGEVIGINGIHKYPLWGNPYRFSDGSLATETQKEKMSKLSWAISINTFLKLAPQFYTSKTGNIFNY
jgi:serine protease Do